MIDPDRDMNRLFEWDEYDGCAVDVIDKNTRRLVGFYDTLQEACEALCEFGLVRAWSRIGIPR